MMTSAAYAQNDRHYNTIQYGLRGLIMNGAMVAGVHDNSAIYYNPAALSSSGVEGLDISLFAVSMEFIKRKNALNTGTSIKQTALALTPGLITFNARPFKNKRISIGGASITRHSFSNIGSEEVIMQTSEGIHINSFSYENIGREFWLAGAIAYAFEKNVSIGMSQYLSIGSVKYEHFLRYRIFDSDEPGMLNYEDSEFLQFRQNQTIGLLNRFGVSWYGDRVKIGATITTPMYGPILLSTRALYDRTMLENGTTTSSTYNISQRGRIRQPFSASLGVEFSGKGYLVAASIEYYHSVNSYRILSASGDGLNPQVNGNDPFDIWDGRRKLFNLNFGIEVRLNPKLDYLGGIRTNLNYNDQPADYTEPRVHYSYFDIYHVTSGFKINVNNSSFTIGADYAFSFNDNLPPVVDLSTGSIAPYNVMNSTVGYNNITFLFTYNFILDRFKGIFGSEDE